MSEREFKVGDRVLNHMSCEFGVVRGVSHSVCLVETDDGVVSIWSREHMQHPPKAETQPAPTTYEVGQEVEVLARMHLRTSGDTWERAIVRRNAPIDGGWEVVEREVAESLAPPAAIASGTVSVGPHVAVCVDCGDIREEIINGRCLDCDEEAAELKQLATMLDQVESETADFFMRVAEDFVVALPPGVEPQLLDCREANETCLHCGGPAYVGLVDVECLRDGGCRPEVLEPEVVEQYIDRRFPNRFSFIKTRWEPGHEREFVAIHPNFNVAGRHPTREGAIALWREKVRNAH